MGHSERAKALLSASNRSTGVLAQMAPAAGDQSLQQQCLVESCQNLALLPDHKTQSRAEQQRPALLPGTNPERFKRVGGTADPVTSGALRSFAPDHATAVV